MQKFTSTWLRGSAVIDFRLARDIGFTSRVAG